MGQNLPARVFMNRMSQSRHLQIRPPERVINESLKWAILLTNTSVCDVWKDLVLFTEWKLICAIVARWLTAQESENALWQMVKCSTELIPLVSWVFSTWLTAVRGISALLRLGTTSSRAHTNFSVMQRRWETTFSSSLGSCRTARTKPSFPCYSSSPSGTEKFRRDFLNGVAPQPPCLLDMSLMNLSRPGTGLFYSLWPLQHPVAVNHSLITPCVNRFNAALEPAISTCKETFSVWNVLFVSATPWEELPVEAHRR